MYLYPYKIFSPSKKVWNPKGNNGNGKMMKYLHSKDDYNEILGIDTYNKMNHREVLEAVGKFTNSYVSVLLEEVKPGVYLGCLDLDHCLNAEGEIEAETKELLKEFDDSEWEFSQSGDGMHIFYLTRRNFEKEWGKAATIVKDIAGCKSFEWYAGRRYILTTTFDFENTDLKIGKHDEFLDGILKKLEEHKNSQKPTMVEDVISMFEGKIIKDEDQLFNSMIAKRQPVEDMYTLRRCGYKDSSLIEIIDTEPSTVDQSAHDAKLIRKLMYYTLSFESAWDMAMKTNYYKHKDEKHKKKFNNAGYKERTRQFIERM